MYGNKPSDMIACNFEVISAEKRWKEPTEKDEVEKLIDDEWEKCEEKILYGDSSDVSLRHPESERKWPHNIFE